MNLRVRPRVKRSDFLLKFAKPCSLLHLKMRRKFCQNIYIVSVIGNYLSITIFQKRSVASFRFKYNILVCQYGSINIAWLSRIDSVLVSCLRDTGSGLLEGRSPVYLKPWIYKMGSNKDVQFMQKSFDMTYQESDCMTIPQQ